MLGWDGVLLCEMLFVEREANVSKISVIMPAYNAERYITEAIQSVIAQTFTDWELIVIDDASQDSTAEIVQKLLIQDTRILFLQNLQNSGVATTRNRGLDIATGEYIAFLDSDDIWLPNKLQLQYDYIFTTNSDLCYTAYQVFSDDDRAYLLNFDVPKTISYDDMLKVNSIGCSTATVRRSILPSPTFNSKLFHEDYVLWLTLLRQGYKACGIQTSLVKYRKGGRSANKLKAAANRWAIYRKSERLGIFHSLYYFICYTINGIRKVLSSKKVI